MTLAFKPLSADEATRLANALRCNAWGGAGLKMGPDTGFVETVSVDGDEATDAEVIDAIKSQPTHYGV
jgi:hypothetical protein